MATIKLKYINSFYDRHHKLRYYFRRPRQKSVALPGRPGSDEFMAAYQAALTGVIAPQKQIGEAQTVPGSVHALVAAYLDSSTGSSSPFKTLLPKLSAARETFSKISVRFTVKSVFIAQIVMASARCC
jgi:hypothetical protein